MILVVMMSIMQSQGVGGRGYLVTVTGPSQQRQSVSGQGQDNLTKPGAEATNEMRMLEWRLSRIS